MSIFVDICVKLIGINCVPNFLFDKSYQIIKYCLYVGFGSHLLCTCILFIKVIDTIGHVINYSNLAIQYTKKNTKNKIKIIKIKNCKICIFLEIFYA